MALLEYVKNLNNERQNPAPAPTTGHRLYYNPRKDSTNYYLLRQLYIERRQSIVMKLEYRQLVELTQRNPDVPKG